MAMKKYTVTLNEKNVEDARELFQKYGNKLSPLLNAFLIHWVTEEKRKQNKGIDDRNFNLKQGGKENKETLDS